MYIPKILKGHDWTCSTHKSPISFRMNHDKKYMRDLELAAGPLDPDTKLILEKEMQFSYRQTIG